LIKVDFQEVKLLHEFALIVIVVLMRAQHSNGWQQIIIYQNKNI